MVGLATWLNPINKLRISGAAVLIRCELLYYINA